MVELAVLSEVMYPQTLEGQRVAQAAIELLLTRSGEEGRGTMIW
jgi:hypothetical protein